MPVSIAGEGALDFTATIDTDSFDTSLDQIRKGIKGTFDDGIIASQKFSQSLQSSVSGIGGSLNSDIVRKYVDQVSGAAAQVQTLLQKGSASLDPSALKAFSESLAGPEEGFKALNQTIDFVKANIGSLKLSPEDTDKLLDSIKQLDSSFSSYTDKQRSAYAELRNMKTALLDLVPGSKAYEDLQLKAGKLSNELTEQNKAIKLLGSNTAGLQAAGSGLRGLIGGFEAVAGAIGLASGESEGLEKTVSTVISAMGVLNGIQEVAEVIDKRSALNQYLIATYRKLSAAATVEQAAATEGLTAAQITETGVTEGLAGATGALNATLLANPAIAVLAGIAALAAGIYFLTQKSTEADEKATRLNKTLLDQYNVAKEIYDLSKFSGNQTIAQAEANVESAKAQNLSLTEIAQRQREVNKLKQDQAAQDVINARNAITGENDFRKGIVDSFNALNKLHGINTKIDLGFEDSSDPNILIAKLQKLENQLTALKNSKNADKNKSEIDKLSSSVDLLKPKLTNYISSLTNFSSVASKSAIENTAEETRQYQASVKSYVDAANAKTEALAKSSEEQLQIQLEAINAQTQAQLNSKANPNLTAGEQERILADSLRKQADLIFAFDQKEMADKAKLLSAEAGLYETGSKERLDLDLAALQVSHNAQIQQFVEINGQLVRYRKLSNDQLAAADDEYYAARKAKILQAAQEESRATLQAQINLDNARISGLTAGSAQDFEARKNLSQDQQNLDIFNAQQSIKNQQELQSKITEIAAKGTEDRKKLEDDFLKHQLENNQKQIDVATAHAKVQNDIVISDPGATAQQKIAAQTDNLNLDADAIAKKAQLVENAILDVIRTGNGDMAALIAQRHLLADQLAKATAQVTNNDRLEKNSALDNISKDLDGVGSALGRLASQTRSSNAGLAEMLTTISNVARSASTLAKTMKDGASDFDKYSAAAEAAIQLIALVINAASARAQAEKQYQQDLISFQEDYNHELNDSILLNTKLKENVFTADFQGELKDSIKAIQDATGQYNSALQKLYASNAVAKDGQKNKFSGTSILSGAASGAVLGAEVGSFIGPEGTVIGGVIGGVAGAIVGLFGGKKKVDTYVSLLQEYPDLVKKGANGQAEINTELAKSLIASNQLNDSTKQLVQDTLDWQDAIDKAQQQLKDVISELAGNLGNDLRDSLVQAFEDGTDAGKAFAASVSKTLQDVVSQLLFQQVFGKAFDQLQKNFADSFAPGGDQSFQDDLQNFFIQYKDLAGQFDDGLKAAQEDAKSAGLDIFQATTDATGAANSLSGQIKGITEDQANLVAGQLGGLRITAIDQLKVATQGNIYLSEISFNTAMILDVKNVLQRLELSGIKIRP